MYVHMYVSMWVCIYVYGMHKYIYVYIFGAYYIREDTGQISWWMSFREFFLSSGTRPPAAGLFLFEFSKK